MPGDVAARAEYARRMQRVLEHIDAHLAEPLDLKALAAVAHFSPYHFHRLFGAWMGLTLGDYLRHRRLETAAARLQADPALPVLTAALDVGFGSGEAFSRAFRQHFGSPPSTWRRQHPAQQAARKSDQAVGNPYQAEGNPDQARPQACRDDGLPFYTLELTNMDVRLIDLPPTHIAYLRYTGPYGPALGEFFGRVFMPWVHAQGLGGRTTYGISLDDPSVTPPSECRCDCAVEVDDGYLPPGDAHVTTLPGGRYAALHFEGSGAEIGAAWKAIFGQWLPASGYQVDQRPCFERYLPEQLARMQGQGFVCDICIPVVPL